MYRPISHAMVLGTLFLKGVFSDTCMTDGGYVEPSACVSTCDEFTDSTPFVGSNSPPVDPVNASTYRIAWCATVPNYDPGDTGVRKSWGYCNEFCALNFETNAPTQAPSVTPTHSPTVTEYFADGAGVTTSSGITPCTIPFTLPDFSGNTEYNTCLDFAFFEPFMGSGGAFPEPANDNRTNTSRWCPTLSAYQVAPSETALRKEWGYCLYISSTEAPTQSPVAPTTPEPTLSPTKMPTSSPTVEMITYASGGGMNVSGDLNSTQGKGSCHFPFRVKGLVNASGEEPYFSSCLSFNVFTPYMTADENWDGPGNQSEELMEYERTHWCAIEQSRYNIAPQTEPMNKYLWAYCFTVRANSPVPTVYETPAPSNSPSLSPTMSPVTSNPTMSPEIGVTNPPTSSQPTQSAAIGVTIPPTTSPEQVVITDAPQEAISSPSLVPTPFPTVTEEEYEYDDGSTASRNFFSIYAAGFWVFVGYFRA